MVGSALRLGPAAGRPLGGIVDADTTLKLDKPELRVTIDRERAADHAGARAARCHRHAVLRAEAQHQRDLLGALAQHRRVGRQDPSEHLTGVRVGRGAGFVGDCSEVSAVLSPRVPT